MLDYLTDVFVHGGTWAAMFAVVIRLWRGRTWRETLEIFLLLAFSYGTVRHLTEPWFEAIGW